MKCSSDCFKYSFYPSTVPHVSDIDGYFADVACLFWLNSSFVCIFVLDLMSVPNIVANRRRESCIINSKSNFITQNVLFKTIFDPFVICHACSGSLHRCALGVRDLFFTKRFRRIILMQPSFEYGMFAFSTKHFQHVYNRDRVKFGQCDERLVTFEVKQYDKR